MSVSPVLDIRNAHEVHFYSDVSSHVSLVADFLAPALTGRAGVAVVAATGPIRSRLREELRAAGVEVSNGRLRELDAVETLARFCSGDRIDRARFRATVGEIVQRAARAAGDGPVCVYGEMVAVLWQAGDIASAIELERAWNELGSSSRFRLMCGYPSALVGPEHEDDFLEVCRLHTAASDTRPIDAKRSLPATPDAARAARHFAVRRLGPFVRGDELHDIEVIISELATNALTHAESPFTVSLRGNPEEVVRIEVTDRDFCTPQLRPAALLASRGRGLSIVSTLATRWGVEPSLDGKTVWAEIVFR